MIGIAQVAVITRTDRLVPLLPDRHVVVFDFLG
jgi:hypothetical protein